MAQKTKNRTAKTIAAEINIHLKRRVGRRISPSVFGSFVASRTSIACRAFYLSLHLPFTSLSSLSSLLSPHLRRNPNQTALCHRRDELGLGNGRAQQARTIRPVRQPQRQLFLQRPEMQVSVSSSHLPLPYCTAPTDKPAESLLSLAWPATRIGNGRPTPQKPESRVTGCHSSCHSTQRAQSSRRFGTICSRAASVVSSLKKASRTPPNGS